MIEILVQWFYTFVTSVCIGCSVLKCIERETKLSLIRSSFIGLIMITWIAGIWTVFYPVSCWQFHILLTALSICSLFLSQPRFDSLNIGDWAVYIFLLSVFILVLVKASGPISNPDSGSYHLPLIKWYEQFPTINGLGNVHFRFGVNYQYLLLCAVYGMSFIKGSTLHGMNGYIYVLFIVYLVSSLDYIKTHSVSVNDLIKLICLFFFVNMAQAVPSFSPDVPAAIMAAMAILLYINDSEKNKFNILIFSIGSFLFKISYFPIIFLNITLIANYIQKKVVLNAVALMFISMLLILPFLYTNYVISGYILFPFYQLDLFDVEWKVPIATAKFFKDSFVNATLRLKKDSDIALIEKIYLWKQYVLTVNSAYIYIFFAFAMSTMLYLYYCFRNIKLVFSQFVLHLVFLVSIVFWLLNAPDPRFASGFLYPFIGYSFSLVIYKVVNKAPKSLVDLFFISMSMLSCFMMGGISMAKTKNNFNKIEFHTLSQANYPMPEDIKVKVEKGNIYYLSTSYCWETPLPCSYPEDNYTYIGTDIHQGFKPIK